MHMPLQTFFSQSSGHRVAVAGAWLAAMTLLAIAPASASAMDGVAAPGEPRLGADCAQTSGTRASFDRIAQELRSQGMALEATCQPGATGWTVKVRVVDGMRAARAVRGPLADGHEVDMGTPAGVAAAPAQAPSGLSPDVQYNREWLRSLMARHQFENLPRTWWLFAERGAFKAGASQVASR